MKLLKTSTLFLLVMLSLGTAYAQSPPANNIDKIVIDYLGIKNALVAGDAVKASLSANALFGMLSQEPDKGLDRKQRQLMAQYIDKLLYDTRHINESKSADHQREHFASLSKNLYEVLKAVRKNTTIIYEQYCPMKKTYWLSETEKIKNPYYGPTSMATCGKTKETLAAVK